MTLKIRSSSTFRRNTPGYRLGTIKRIAKYTGQLYTFQYTSWGHHRKGRQKKNLDRYPLLLLAYHDQGKVWKAKNGKRYIYGFNLNYLSEDRRLKVLRNLDTLAKGVKYSYEELKGALNLPVGNTTTIFRKYDIRGSKLRYLKEVDLDKYEDYLEHNIESIL